MATNYPTSLDNFTNPASTDLMNSVTVPHNEQHANANDAIEALQAKVGVDSSAVTSSLDYKVAQLEAGATGGKILQVVSTTKTDTFSASVARATTTAITGLSASITPSSATSKILVMGQVNCASGATAGEAPVTVLTRGGTAICVGDAAGSRSRATSSSGLTSVTSGVDNKEGLYSVGILFLDSPSTTSATTYAVELGSTFYGTQTVYCNREAGTLDRDDVWRTTSTLTVMEVSA